MSETFTREKEQILTQFIIHHDVSDAEVGELTERLDTAMERALELHAGQKRRTGEDYIWHPLRTTMEVSRFGRIVDWAAIEAALLHDTLEDTTLEFKELAQQFPEAANLVLALTKIKDSRVHTYQKLFSY
ncbi:MAG TPA: HD domain-containing protein, partial [Deferrisomatales bacterium]|nr:HD domain-containing protein [Deferrisomatales bacterium]